MSNGSVIIIEKLLSMTNIAGEFSEKNPVNTRNNKPSLYCKITGFISEHNQRNHYGRHWEVILLDFSELDWNWSGYLTPFTLYYHTSWPKNCIREECKVLYYQERLWAHCIHSPFFHKLQYTSLGSVRATSLSVFVKTEAYNNIYCVWHELNLARWLK
jgi:hypothetical protein